MSDKKPNYVHDGVRLFQQQGQPDRKDYVRAWQEGRGRNADIIVQVWVGKDKPEGEPEGDWAMPGVLGIPACIAQAVVQTPAPVVVAPAPAPEPKGPTIISVGPDEADPVEKALPENAAWCVYLYEQGDYEGSGEAYVGTKDGKFFEASLGHCSCYGPWEGGWSGEPQEWSLITRDELISMHLAGDTERAVKLKAAIFPLINEPLPSAPQESKA